MAKISFSANIPAEFDRAPEIGDFAGGSSVRAIDHRAAGVLDPSDSSTVLSAAGVADDDRRRTGRAGVTVRIDYATVDEMFSEFTRDINEGGLFIETEKPHQPGTEVAMQFHLPGSQEVLRTLGRVVRVTSGDTGAPSGMGIEFDELTAADRAKIDLIVRALRAGGAV